MNTATIKSAVLAMLYWSRPLGRTSEEITARISEHFNKRIEPATVHVILSRMRRDNMAFSLEGMWFIAFKGERDFKEKK